MSNQPRIDAVRSPAGYAGPGTSAERLGRLAREFAPLLAVSRIFVRNQGCEHFVSGGPDDTLFFPRDDPRSGEPRYRWEDRGDGISFGYLDPVG